MGTLFSKSVAKAKARIGTFSFVQGVYAILCMLCIVWIARLAASSPFAVVQVEQSFGGERRLAGNLWPTRDQRFLLAALESDCVVFARDTQSGKLSVVQRLFEKPNPVFATCVALTSDERSVFIRSHNWENAISYYQRDPETGLLKRDGGYAKQGRLAPLNDISSILLDHSDRRLFALSDTESALIVFNVDNTGQLNLSQIIQDDSAGQRDPFSGITISKLQDSESVDRLGCPTTQSLSHDGRFLYVGAGGDHPGDAAVTVFDVSSDAVRFVESVSDAPLTRTMRLFTPQSVIVSPDDRHVYVACSPFTLLAFRRDAPTGKLTWLQTVGDGRTSFLELDRATTMIASKSGKYVYVGALRAKDQSVLAVFRRDQESGRLELVESITDSENGRMSTMAISHDGAFLYTRYDNRHISVRAIPESWR